MSRNVFLIGLVSCLALFSCEQNKKQLVSTDVIPTPQQLAYQQMELIGFIHFSINTFTNKEWGYGDESPGLFNPSALDARQWALTAKEAGMKQLILTAKHHDGFCLWPSAYTEHSVKNSPWLDGNGDLVKEFTDACREYGLKCGLYLSPWDRNHKDYGQPEYLDYYRKQLTELLSNYGEISEIWFDGANGGDGYYGGANEVRHIDRKEYYDWDSTFRLVYSLQPDIIIFSDAGPGCRWIGNERGIAGETNWSTIHGDSLTIGGSKQAYLNTGDQDGKDWMPGECDVSIRPGWFYHASHDSLVKSLDELIEIYYGSVGRNGVLLLNIPPDQRGLIHENDALRLSEFSDFINRTFDYNQASGIEVSEVVELAETGEFNLIVLGEDIALGQRVHSFRIEQWQQGSWKYLAEGTTIGYKRILETNLTRTSRLKFTFKSAKGSPVITTFGLYRDARKRHN